MAVPSTTFALIREGMVTAIKALSPVRHSADKFIHAPREAEFADFREWAEGFDETIFRWYSIKHLNWEFEGVSDLDVEWRRSEAEIVVAYAHHWATYGDDNMAEMQDIVEEDMDTITTAVGFKGGANYVSGQGPVIEGPRSIEEGDGVSFAVIPLEIFYYYDVN